MINREEFYRALGDYFGVPSDVTITKVDEDATYYEGCPTCGGDMEYSVYISGLDAEGKPFGKEYSGTLADFIQSL